MTVRLKSVVFLLSVSLLTYAQQTPIYSHYMLDGFAINSAMAGYDGLLTYNLITRQQWLGFENAPRTFSFSSQIRMPQRGFSIKVRPRKGNKFLSARKGRVGLGFSLVSDRNGYFINTTSSFAYAYHIPMRNRQFSLGLQCNVSQFKIDKSGIDFRNPDPYTFQINNPIYVPDINVGAFYYNFLKRSYLGFSIKNFLQAKIKFGNPYLKNYKNLRQYFFMAGYTFYDQNNFQYEPSMLVKTTEGLILQGEASVKVYYKTNYWLGLSYRTEKTIVTLFGAKWNNFYVGYAFDYDFNAFQRFTFGSHELYLSLKFGEPIRPYLKKKRR